MISYTKQLMVDAMKTLLRQKPLNKITVSDIAGQCGASKQTFYNHFQDKFALFTFAVTTVLQKNLEDAERNSDDYKTCILNYYSLILEERDFYRAAIRDDTARSLIYECIKNNSAEHFRRLAKERYHVEQLDICVELAITFNAVGNAQLLVDWIRSGMQTSPKIMAEVNYACIPEGLKFLN